MSEKKVAFFVCGTQKGGTTALDRLLRLQSSVVQLPVPRKELHFFDSDNLDWAEPNYDWLENQFSSDVTTVRGECTPIYMYWPNAIERLHEYNPDARIIVLLRHPAHRAFSHWRMETTRGNDTLSFTEAIHDNGRARVTSSPGGVHRIYSYVERGFYDSQIRRLLQFFPREQIMFLTTEELWIDPRKTLAQILDFITSRTVSETQIFLPEDLYISPVDTAGVEAKLSRNDQGFLTSLYRDHIYEAARLTGLQLDPWLDESYCEPMPRPSPSK